MDDGMEVIVDVFEFCHPLFQMLIFYRKSVCTAVCRYNSWHHVEVLTPTVGIFERLI